MRRLCDKHGVTCIAIGNGTASRESELFVSQFIKEYDKPLAYHGGQRGRGLGVLGLQAGCPGVPDFDVSLRSAVSIARRLQDPLAELVKIDPKAIGVGPVPARYAPGPAFPGPGRGGGGLCLNGVGVDLNTASPLC